MRRVCALAVRFEASPLSAEVGVLCSAEAAFILGTPLHRQFATFERGGFFLTPDAVRVLIVDRGHRVALVVAMQPVCGGRRAKKKKRKEK